ncbi:hypothetical protein [Mastigocoleus testarum]|uniref:Uncharacterized protein n=1 Tax=Mastigocoleus testarum BC008 TaxID=371196 RepID=A0A0V7ZD85_9CYAN|nr:hypothetical protein [Mastigocoleus testarum]KST62246.1 hypothetical protein BC008_08745 [Mastigocoleus testarum BC008]
MDNLQLAAGNTQLLLDCLELNDIEALQYLLDCLSPDQKQAVKSVLTNEQYQQIHQALKLYKLKKNLKVGDCIVCHPTRLHFHNNWLVEARVKSIGFSGKKFTCTVSYLDQNRKQRIGKIFQADWILRKADKYLHFGNSG